MAELEPGSDYDKMALAAATEINALRDNIVRLGAHSVALNQVVWALGEALGLTEGEKTFTAAPLQLVRDLVAHRDALEGKVLEVVEVLEHHKGLVAPFGMNSAGYDIWQDVHLAVLDD